MAKRNFITYVVSDDPNKYPTDGEHGGYYYELFDGSGAYVWKKYNVEFVQGTSVTVTLQNDGTSINLYTIDNLYLKDDSTVGIQGDVAKTVAISSLLEGTVLGGMNSTYYAYGEDGLVYAYPRCSSDETAITISNPVTAEKGEFIDYVVSDNSNAFPDGDVHSDGYWYESTGYSTTIDGATYKEDLSLITKIADLNISTLPYLFVSGSAVILNNEIHILGSNASSNYYRYHYKWNGNKWTSVSTLPYDFCSGSAVVFNNEIHILGSDRGGTAHYKWNGSSWTSVSTLPYNFRSGSAVVFNNEIHIFGSSASSSYYTNHYKWNGSSWTSVSTLPYSFYAGSTIVLNNEIHILGGASYGTYHYKLNGSSWTSVSTLPYNFCNGSAVVLNNEIHILGSSASSSYYTYHYKFDGSSWTAVSILPYNFYSGSAVVLNNEIHILGSGVNGNNTKHYGLNLEIYRKSV